MEVLAAKEIAEKASGWSSPRQSFVKFPSRTSRKFSVERVVIALENVFCLWQIMMIEALF
jgi:hypothetical protein